MSTDLARRPRGLALHEWDKTFANLVKATVLKPKNRDATDAELALFAEQAQRTGLDPMARQIYGVFRKSRGAEQMTIQVGIDGLRTIAERSGTYLGQTGPFWCGEDGKWQEVWFSKEPPAAAKVVVRKLLGGQVAETPAVAHFGEYVPMYDGQPMGLWKEKPALMLAKCAEALALRKAFPQDMSGLYTDDEMQRADAQAPPSPAPIELPEEVVDAEPVTDPEPTVSLERAVLLASGADTIGVDRDLLQRAVAHAYGDDAGPCGTTEEAVSAIGKLTEAQAVVLDKWLQKKADEVSA